MASITKREWVAEYDDDRTKYLRANGIEIVRIANEQLARDSWLVEQVIETAILRRL